MTAMAPVPSFEDHPLTRQEYITAMVHFYRGEMHRSLSWRQRLDATTNWSVLTTAGMLSFSFTAPENPHIVLLLSNLIVLAYLTIEARRYRYFEVYRARVRMLEENFLIPIVTRNLESPMAGWREALSKDLDRPKYKTTLIEAIGFRLRRNYFSIFMIILGGWMLKLYIHPYIMLHADQLYERVAVGSVPAGIVLGAGFLFYVGLAVLMWFGRHIHHGGSPDDEIVGIEGDLGEWKI